MSKNITIRDLKNNEIGIAASFFKKQWDSNHIFYRNKNLLSWLYQNNPSIPPTHEDKLTFKVAFDNDQLVGVFAYIPFVLNIYGRKNIGSGLSAWWVDPQYRQGSIAISLLFELQHRSNFQALLAGINTDIAEKLYKQMKWLVIENIPRVILPIDINQMISLLPSNCHTCDEAFDIIKSHSNSNYHHCNNSEIEISELPSLTKIDKEQWNNFFWQEIAPTYLGPARNYEYLFWRYENIPIFSYHFILAKERNKITGLLIYRVEKIKFQQQLIYRIVDIISLPKTIPSMIDNLVKCATNNKIAFIDYFSTHQEINSTLSKCNFIDAISNDGDYYWFPHLFQPMDINRNRLNMSWWVKDFDYLKEYNKSNLLISKGDYEFDRPN